nr:hypothetical protein [Tanacetum cinerariifolium]
MIMKKEKFLGILRKIQFSKFVDEKEWTCSNGVAANELLGADVDEDFDGTSEKIIKVKKKEYVNIDEQVFDADIFIQLLEKFKEGFKNTGLPAKHDYEKGKVSRDIAKNSIFKEWTCSNGVAANELLGADVDEDFDGTSEKIIKVKKKEYVNIDEQVFDAEYATSYQ